MNRKIVKTIALETFVLVVVLSAPWQTRGLDTKAPYPSMAPLDQYLMERNAEIALARSAAPESISRDAEVLVLGRHGYETSVKGASTGTWTPTGSMTQPRCYHDATLLPNGEVLVAGGVDSLYNSPDISATAELYNPSTGTWQATGSLNTSRASQGALLENGQVLVAGGYNTSNSDRMVARVGMLRRPTRGLVRWHCLPDRFLHD